MIIGILQVDSVLPKFRDRFENYPEMFHELLTSVARPDEVLEFIDYDVQNAELPVHLDECDGYLITGSKDSVYDDLAWIKDLEAFVQSLHAAKKKLLGICFGHQLIANCLGGESARAEQGWVVGVQSSEITSNKRASLAWMEPSAISINLISSHKDQVIKPPEGAKVYCGNEKCPVGGFSLGEHIITFQGHPEFSAAYSKALMQHRYEILGEDCVNAGLESLQKPLSAKLLARWILNFYAA